MEIMTIAYHPAPIIRPARDYEIPMIHISSVICVITLLCHLHTAKYMQSHINDIIVGCFSGRNVHPEERGDIPSPLMGEGQSLPRT